MQCIFPIGGQALVYFFVHVLFFLDNATSRFVTNVQNANYAILLTAIHASSYIERIRL